MSEEILDEYLSSELKPKKAKEKVLDYQALTHFIKSNFPISKTDYILKVVESLKDQTNITPNSTSMSVNSLIMILTYYLKK